MGLFNMYGIPVFPVMNDSPSADDEILPENKTITETPLRPLVLSRGIIKSQYTQGLRTSS